jgi:hypothetical protein
MRESKQGMSDKDKSPVSKRPLSKTCMEVTILGLGKEVVLRTFGQAKKAVP